MVTKKKVKTRGIVSKVKGIKNSFFNTLKPHSTGGINEKNSQSCDVDRSISEDLGLSSEGNTTLGFEDGVANAIDFGREDESSQGRKDETESKNGGDKVQKGTKDEKKPKKRPVSSRILQLATPRPLPPDALNDLKYEPFRVRNSALRYKASKRIKQLAQPVPRHQDTKKNAFKVKKASLKAVCSERIKQLAQAKRWEPPKRPLLGKMLSWSISSVFSISSKLTKKPSLPMPRKRLKKKKSELPIKPALSISRKLKREVLKAMVEDEDSRDNDEECGVDQTKIKIDLSERAQKSKMKRFKKKTRISQRLVELSRPRVFNK